MLSSKFWGNCLVLNKDRNDISRFAEVGKAQHTSIPFRMDHDYPSRKDGVEVTGNDFVTCMNKNPLNFVEFSNITSNQPVIDALMEMY